MGFLRRDKKRSARPHSAPREDAIPDEDVERVIDELTEIVVDGIDDVPLTPDTLELLQAGLPYLTGRECSFEAVLAGQTAARLGYVARSVEFVSFEAARAADPDLLDALTDRLQAAHTDARSAADARAELAAAMAASEPVDPSPQQDGPSWTLPGLGGHVRGRLRDALLSELERPADVPSDELKRTWKYGYFLRVLDELFFEAQLQP